MGASESICHQHHTHSTWEEAQDCNRAAERELQLQRKQAENTFVCEAKKKHSELAAQKMKTLEKKMDILGSLFQSQLDLRQPDHQDVVQDLIFEDSTVAAAVVGVVQNDSLTVVGWIRNPLSSGRPNRYLTF